MVKTITLLNANSFYFLHSLTSTANWIEQVFQNWLNIYAHNKAHRAMRLFGTSNENVNKNFRH